MLGSSGRSRYTTFVGRSAERQRRAANPDIPCVTEDVGVGAVKTQVGEADLRGLLDVVAAFADGEGSAWPPPSGLEGIHALIGCDDVSFNDFDPSARRFYSLTEHPAHGEDYDHDPFWAGYWDNSFCSYPQRSGDNRSVIKLSDFYSRRGWHETATYRDCLGRFGVEHEMLMSIHAPAGRSRRLVFFRCSGSDFSERDRLLLSLLRPHLQDAYQQHERVLQGIPDLTHRQWQLLRLVAAGHTNVEIARSLHISVGTVRTHLEHIFERLEVATRGAAVARAFPHMTEQFEA